MTAWQAYYQASARLEPRPFFLEALGFVGVPSTSSKAIDLGCGEGLETIHLLKQGWQVSAIDKEAAALQGLFKKLEPSLRKNLSMQVSSFEKASLPKADFIYAGLSLPFCPPEQFLKVWSKITEALVPEGTFAGHFFGIHDDWANNQDMSFYSKQELEQLCAAFEIVLLRDLEEDAKTALGIRKHWHYFELIIRKPGE
jgi:SAM-dependent methyltransferase